MCAAGLHSDAAGELGIFKSALVLLPGIAGCKPRAALAEARLPWAESAAPLGLKKTETEWLQRFETASYLSTIHAWHLFTALRLDLAFWNLECFMWVSLAAKIVIF